MTFPPQLNPFTRNIQMNLNVISQTAEDYAISFIKIARTETSNSCAFVFIHCFGASSRLVSLSAAFFSRFLFFLLAALLAFLSWFIWIIELMHTFGFGEFAKYIVEERRRRGEMHHSQNARASSWFLLYWQHIRGARLEWMKDDVVPENNWWL